MSDTISISEAARRLGCGRHRVEMSMRAYVAARERGIEHPAGVPAVPCGSRLIIPRIAFERMMTGPNLEQRQLDEDTLAEKIAGTVLRALGQAISGTV